ncbi:MAG: hypothetical protein ACE3JU_11620 [Paenibacillus sp.]|uniref:hypothetical protein n=1 Tax=Paenibacillus sp. TaxID=58172 RepID=UPI003B7ACEB4
MRSAVQNEFSLADSRLINLNVHFAAFRVKCEEKQISTNRNSKFRFCLASTLPLRIREKYESVGLWHQIKARVCNQGGKDEHSVFASPSTFSYTTNRVQMSQQRINHTYGYGRCNHVAVGLKRFITHCEKKHQDESHWRANENAMAAGRKRNDALNGFRILQNANLRARVDDLDLELVEFESAQATEANYRKIFDICDSEEQAKRLRVQQDQESLASDDDDLDDDIQEAEEMWEWKTMEEELRDDPEDPELDTEMEYEPDDMTDIPGDAEFMEEDAEDNKELVQEDNVRIRSGGGSSHEYQVH